VNDRDSGGWTALHFATGNLDEKTIRI
jgi:hypothetical protein